MIRAVLRFFLFLFAALAFLAASLLSSAPIVTDPPAPQAADVGAARMLAMRSLWAVRNARPVEIPVRQSEIASAARLISHGTPGLAIDSRIKEDRLQTRASYQLAPQTWVNLSADVAAHAPGGSAHIGARIGSLSFPPGMSETVVDTVLKWIWQDQTRPPPRLADLFTGVRFDRQQILMTVNVPRELIQALGRLSSQASADGSQAAWDTYEQLTRSPPERTGAADLAAIYRRAFAGPAVSEEVAAGRTVGVAAALVGPQVLRLAGATDIWKDGDMPPPIAAQLNGRVDLAKHFALSAALATKSSPLGTALGEWKELDDSLPGGSGFSFIDLAADRAGLRLGQALADSERSARTQALLARARPGDLLPLTALDLTEGLTDEEFEADFGTIRSRSFRLARAHIDRQLDPLPLYAD